MMKKLLQALAIILLPFVYFTVMGSITGEEETSRSNTSSYKPTGVQSYLPSFKDEFVNIIFNKGYSGGTNFVPYRLDRMRDSMHFNGSQNYFWQDSYYGNILGNPLDSNQISRMNSLMADVHNAGLKGIYNRNKIADAIINSQRVVYEVAPGNNQTSVNNGFVYKTMTGDYGIDEGNTVRYADDSTMSEGYLCRDIYENMQHSENIGNWGWTDTQDWHLKPRMKIRESDFSETNTTPVVGIEIIDFAGNSIGTIVVNVNNFRDAGGDYDGSYIDDFTFDPIGPDSLTFSGEKGTGGLNNGWVDIFNGGTSINKVCSVDFKIYWYGYVDVWFDKLTVDDEDANNLFSGMWDDNIKEEVQEFWPGSNNSNYFFFIDELFYSNMPAAKYVYDSARIWKPGVRLSSALTNHFNMLGIRSERPLSLETFFDIIQPEVFTLDVHEIGGWKYVPESLSYYYPNYRPNSVWYQNNTLYNNFLQNRVLGDKSEATGRTPENSFYTTDYDAPEPRGSFVYQVRKARDLSDSLSPNAKMIVQPQIHSGVLRQNGQNQYDQSYGFREPTNQEIEAQAVIALSHGADGLCWFIYDSFSLNPEDPGDMLLEDTYGSSFSAGDSLFHFGLGKLGWVNELRIFNDYGQNKIRYIDSLNQKLLNWKVYLDRIDWYDGVSVHKETANRYFISDIVSIAPYINGVNSCEEDGPYTFTDCDEEKFWEFGFFAPKEPSDFTEYLTVVNRRCEPEYMDGSTPKGDVRVLKIKFNGANLAGFTNWKLTDVYTQQSVTFNKNYTGAIDLGSKKTHLAGSSPAKVSCLCCHLSCRQAEH